MSCSAVHPVRDPTNHLISRRAGNFGPDEKNQPGWQNAPHLLVNHRLRDDQMSALSKIVSWLSCPVCNATLSLQPPSLRCRAGHTFDIAKQGYVNLANSKPPANADTAEMVLARQRFLNLGHYRPIAEALVNAAGDGNRILEVGAGTAYYLSAVVDGEPGRLGLASDVSAQACRRAARSHDRIAAVVADTWRGIPVRGKTVDVVLCVFAPRNPTEFLRVLAPGGRMIIVTPEEDHLASLRASHSLLNVHPDKAEELLRTFSSFDLISTSQLSYAISLDAEAVADLIGMGPNAFHQRIGTLKETRTTVSVRITVFGLPPDPR